MNRFKDILKGRVVIVGIGNLLRADDGFGPALIEHLKIGGHNTNFESSLSEISIVSPYLLIDAGSAPENYTGKIIRERPETILIVDAVDLGKPPGSWTILESEEIVASGFTTHDLSPRLFLDYLKQETKARIYLLALQPESLSLGQAMTPLVRQATEELAVLLKGALCTSRI